MSDYTNPCGEGYEAWIIEDRVLIERLREGWVLSTITPRLGFASEVEASRDVDPAALKSGRSRVRRAVLVWSEAEDEELGSGSLWPWGFQDGVGR